MKKSIFVEERSKIKDIVYAIETNKSLPRGVYLLAKSTPSPPFENHCFPRSYIYFFAKLWKINDF